ncbi:MAG: GGDEF domain-containing response regulator [Acidithiobacillus sp.]
MDRRIFERLRETGRLPSPKGVSLEVARLVDAQNTTSRDLAQVIQSDPALTGKLLRLANIAIHLERRPVVAIGEAILILGFAQVKRLVLALSLMSDPGRPCPAFPYAAFWTRSLLTGLVAQRLVKQLGMAPVDEMFTVGLLSQVGRLALASLYPQDYAALLAAPEAADPRWLRQQEYARLAVDHDELTAVLLEDWGLPQVYVEAAYFQATNIVPRGCLPGERHVLVAQMLHLADLVSGLCLSPVTGREGQEEVLAVAGHLGVSRESLFALGEDLLQRWGEWSGLLQEVVPIAAPFTPGAPAAAGVSASADAFDPAESFFGSMAILLVAAPGKGGHGFPEGLIGRGHDVLVVESPLGTTAFDPLRPAQMVIVDWRLPDAPCRNDCAVLRAAPWAEPPYILGVGPALDQGQLLAAFQAGLDAYETAPLSSQVLDAHLQVVSRLQEAYRAHKRKWQKLHRFAATLAHSNRELRQAALTDPLTGLRNRRYAMERLQQEWAVAERHGGDLAVMLLDLDQFKEINDGHGHELGDEVLRQFGIALRGLARQQDVICRIGGDEFLVICPETPPAGARALGERICQGMDTVPLPAAAQGRLHVSMGIASLQDGVRDAEALLRAADHALYMAKRGGRNQVVVYAHAGAPG